MIRCAAVAVTGRRRSPHHPHPPPECRESVRRRFRISLALEQIRHSTSSRTSGSDDGGEKLFGKLEIRRRASRPAPLGPRPRPGPDRSRRRRRPVRVPRSVTSTSKSFETCQGNATAPEQVEDPGVSNPREARDSCGPRGPARRCASSTRPWSRSARASATLPSRHPGLRSRPRRATRFGFLQATGAVAAPQRAQETPRHPDRRRRWPRGARSDLAQSGPATRAPSSQHSPPTLPPRFQSSRLPGIRATPRRWPARSPPASIGRSRRRPMPRRTTYWIRESRIFLSTRSAEI